MNLDTSARPLDVVTPDDARQFCFWRFVPSRDGRIWVKPLKAKKAKNFVATLVCTKCICADGTTIDSLIEGIDTETPEYSRHYRQLHVWIQEKKCWFCLARYNDAISSFDERGPEALAILFGKSITQMFPIKFDISPLSTISSPALAGGFEINPIWGVSRETLMEILVKELNN